MKIVICWSGVSGYLSACWRELANVRNVDLTVFAEPTNRPYNMDILDGIDVKVLSDYEWQCPGKMARLVIREKADIIVIAGWSRKGFYGLPFQKELKNRPIVLAMDTPWRGEWRQYLARIYLRSLVKKLDGVIVAGERGFQYAKRLGFCSYQICSGVYGFDYDSFNGAVRKRRTGGKWPQQFLFVGRYVEAKGIKTLLKAYQAYRKCVENPWALNFYGTGPMAEMITDIQGIYDNGFCQPADLTDVFSSHGVFIMPSYYEPWGVALAEACAAGLPVVCTTEVCSSIDLVRHLYNGYVVSPNDVSELTLAMIWMHENYSSLAEMGSYSQYYAKAYSAQMWAKRWLWFLTKLANK